MRLVVCCPVGPLLAGALPEEDLNIVPHLYRFVRFGIKQSSQSLQSAADAQASCVTRQIEKAASRCRRLSWRLCVATAVATALAGGNYVEFGLQVVQMSPA